MKKTKPILYDRVIIHRVKQYLEENVHQTYLDVGVMTRQLQNRYPEYSRRKVSPFRLLVEQAYRIVSQSYGLDNVSSEDIDSNSDIEVMDEEPQTPPSNPINDMMVNLYSKSKSSSSSTTTTASSQPNTNTNITTAANTNSNVNTSGSAVPGENIPISISSDESDGGGPQQKQQQQQQKPQPQQQQQQQPQQQPKQQQPQQKQQQKQPQQKQQQQQQKQQTPKATKEPGKAALEEKLKAVVAESGKPSAETPANIPVKKKQTVRFDDSGSIKRGSATGSGEENALNKKRRLSDERVLHSVKIKKSDQLNLGGNDVTPTTKSSPSASTVSIVRQKKFKKDITLKESNCKFSNVGGMENTIQDLCEVLMCFKYPTLYHTVGLNPPRGILLHGPPGCGKTLFANCIAGQLGIKIIETPATELIAGISGESEERIRDVFEQAAMNAPCVLFIDEIDSISSNRANSQKDMERRMVSQLISSLDGLQKHENSDGVLVVGATTRPDVLDPALRRVGRFDHEISIGIPDRKSRRDILKIICEKLSVKDSIDFDKIAELTPGYVGADLFALCSRAASVMVRRKCLELYRTNQKNIPVVDLMDDNEVIMTNVEDLSTKIVKDDKIILKPANTTNEEIVSLAEQPNEDDGIKNTTTDSSELGSMILESKSKPEKENGAENDADIQNVEINKAIDKEIVSGEVKKNEDKVIVENTTGTEQTEQTKPETLGSSDVINISAVLKLRSNTTKISTATAKDKGEGEGAGEGEDEGKSDETSIRKDPTILDLMNSLDSSSMKSIQSDLVITFDDFKDAIKLIQPSSKREGFITVPDVTWDDIGSLKSIREELQLAILAPVKYPQKLDELGLSSPSGVLLCGPPGCGKTLLAKAIANEAGINFISIKGPELMNMYVGESERAVRTCFQRARNSAPCVIFFDEFDSLCPKRSLSSHESGTRIVNQLLTEMDGVEARKGVYLMAATNRPDIIDPAILRPGRLDTILFVGLPEESDREEILLALTKNKTKPALGPDVDLKEIAVRTENFSGADLAGLIRQAAMQALKESLLNNGVDKEPLKIKYRHINEALIAAKPSVGLMERKLYERLRVKYMLSSNPEKCPMDENLQKI